MWGGLCKHSVECMDLRQMTRWTVIWATFTLVAAAGAPVFAQSPRAHAHPTAEQAQLNDQAVEALVRGKHARAVALLEQYLMTGKSNIAYLNLGRAYQKLGNCQKARQALEAALTAPVVDNPGPELVDQRAHKYLNELDTQCEAGEAPAKSGAKTAAAPAESTSAETTPAETTPQAPPTGAKRTTVATPPADAGAASSSQRTWGWIAVGSGAVLAGGALALFLKAHSLEQQVTTYDGGVNTDVTQVEAQQDQDTVGTLQTVSLSMAIAAGVAAGAGTYLLVGGDDERPSSVAVDVPVGQSAGVHVSWTTHF